MIQPTKNNLTYHGELTTLIYPKCQRYKHFKTRILALSEWFYDAKFDLRNESYVFSVDRGINKKKEKTTSMRVVHCCKGFPFFFSVATLILMV